MSHEESEDLAVPIVEGSVSLDFTSPVVTPLNLSEIKSPITPRGSDNILNSFQTASLNGISSDSPRDPEVEDEAKRKVNAILNDIENNKTPRSEVILSDVEDDNESIGTNSGFVTPETKHMHQNSLSISSIVTHESIDNESLVDEIENGNTSGLEIENGSTSLSLSLSDNNQIKGNEGDAMVKTKTKTASKFTLDLSAIKKNVEEDDGELEEIDSSRSGRSTGRLKRKGKYSDVESRYLKPTPRKKVEKFVPEKWKKTVKRTPGRKPIFEREIKINTARREEIERKKGMDLKKRMKPHKQKSFRKKKNNVPGWTKDSYLRPLKRKTNLPNPKIQIEERKRVEALTMSKMVSPKSPFNRKSSKRKFGHVKSQVIGFIRNENNFKPKEDGKRFMLEKKREKERTVKRLRNDKQERAKEAATLRAKKKRERLQKKVKASFKSRSVYKPRKRNDILKIEKDIKKREGVFCKKSRSFNWGDRSDPTYKRFKVRSKVWDWEREHADKLDSYDTPKQRTLEKIHMENTRRDRNKVKRKIDFI